MAEEIIPVFNMIFLVIISAVSLIGILASAFIVALNLLDWAKGRRLTTCDLILVALGIACTCSQCTFVGNAYLYVLCRASYDFENISTALLSLHLYIGSTSVWLTACLCVFYCVKIVDFNHWLCSWLKLRISKMVPWLLLGSFVEPPLLNMLLYWSSYKVSSKYPTANSTANATVPGSEMRWTLWNDVGTMLLGLCLPLLVCMASITLILTSLYSHIRRMKENTSGFSRTHLEPHFGAARLVGSLLLVYIFLTLAELAYTIPPSYQLEIAAKIIFASSAPAQSIILIQGNAKLKKVLLMILSPSRK
ncbi:taste receptor type 2 member 9-like [Lissotriton helveticus]